MTTKKQARRPRKSSEIVIPDKLYFRIGEVADLCRLPAYVLRFWESEFPQLKPVKSSTGQRMYRQRDAKNVLHVALTVHALSGRAFYRLQLRKLRLPETQHVGGKLTEFRHFTNAEVQLVGNN